MSMHNTNRRDFLKQSAAAAGALAMAGGVPLFANEGEKAHPVVPMGKAEHCIMVWLGGGAAQIDTWDPKAKGDAKAKKAGGYYDAIDTAVPGLQVCEHLKRCAPLMERFNPIRTVNHDVIDEHAAATNQMHTGRNTSGTIVYPSIGSVVAYQRGAASDVAPPYMLIGYPNVTRGPGFLGSSAGYVYLTDTNQGPNGLARMPHISDTRAARREDVLDKLRSRYLTKAEEKKLVTDYAEAGQAALRLSGPEFMKAFDLKNEPDSLRNKYGGEFGQRCLLSRRLVERGVRFIEVSHNLNFVNGTGWDTHNEGQLNQHLLIQELDGAISTLVTDLEEKKLLDKTLIVISSEFGRPAQFDGGGGRGHHGGAFTVVLAGGGLQTGKAIGVTDELAMKIEDRPVSVPDLFATIYQTLGINPYEELYAGDRPVPITDGGHPIAELFS
ncbi:DUF1501 domain-containing protein [Blastopirellula sp. JC732]|uniref:DUF1501 domain-containing protein n=1 Tax=Blastopirellula sediminis TaxID=2894196 RepID=A0A9X1SFR9_9BACT|nr:DUF1501 domain-containing protein [Blastopirellula sediminis]MCC9607222.1 DUF1501 domain-containing protein [Blastopirellula sediminis]MCC9629485.1 DUF1501 domain-containing protein [Blastopirellula sediminis]